MDIKLPLAGFNQATLTKLTNAPALKVGQTLSAQVLATELESSKLSITLKLGNDTVTLQSNQPVSLTPGQTLQLQLIKLTPVAEFQVALPAATTAPNTPLLATAQGTTTATPVMPAGPVGNNPLANPNVAVSANPATNPAAISPGTAGAATAAASPATAYATAGTLSSGPTATLLSAADTSISSKATLPTGLTFTAPATVLAGLRPGPSQFNNLALPVPANSSAAPRPGANTAASVMNNGRAAVPVPGNPQLIEFEIVGVSGDKIQLQPVNLKSSPSAATLVAAGNPDKPPVIVVSRSQLLQSPALETLDKPAPGKTGLSVMTPTAPQTPAGAASDLKIGRHLTLEVTQIDNGFSFKLPAPGRPIAAAQVNDLVRQFLPRHESAQELLSQIAKALPQLLPSDKLPAVLKQAILAVINDLPATAELSQGSGVKKALTDSGLLLEPKLANPAGMAELDLQHDLKGNLLKLVKLLKVELGVSALQNQAPQELDILKTLHQKAENVLAKITLEQLNSLPEPDNPKQIWHLEIPYLHNGNTEAMSMQIQWQKESDPERTPSEDWTVQITIAPPQLGTIHCTIVYKDKFISTYFKSAQADTYRLITAHLDELKKQLEAGGLQTGNLVAQQGTVKPAPAHRSVDQKLFEAKA